VKAPLSSRLRRRRFSAWATLIVRALAAGGLLLAAVLAAGERRGLLSLGFLTGVAILSIAVARAQRTTRDVGAALRLHRTVEAALSALSRRGWQLKHNVRWPEGPGDGHLAMTATGDLAFAIKDCPTSIADFDLTQTQKFATALSGTGRPYVPICVTTASEARSSSDRGVICCAADLLVAELLDAERGFVASLADETAHSRLLYGESSDSADQA
jgi:hypothetical protein